MVQEFFSGIADAFNSAMFHVRNADTLTLALVIGGVVLFAYFLFRR
jgi:hypothetical protein